MRQSCNIAVLEKKNGVDYSPVNYENSSARLPTERPWNYQTGAAALNNTPAEQKTTNQEKNNN